MTEVTSIVRPPATIRCHPHRWFFERRMMFDVGFRRHGQRATIYSVSTIVISPSWYRTVRMQVPEGEWRDARYTECALLP